MDFMHQKDTPKDTSIYPHLFFFPLAKTSPRAATNEWPPQLVSAAYRMVNNANTFKGSKLTATNSEELGELIIKNVQRVISKKESDDYKVWSLKVDEIAVEKRLRFLISNKNTTESLSVNIILSLNHAYLQFLHQQGRRKIFTPNHYYRSQFVIIKHKNNKILFSLQL